jgi:hypothetical protein
LDWIKDSCSKVDAQKKEYYQHLQDNAYPVPDGDKAMFSIDIIGTNIMGLIEQPLQILSTNEKDFDLLKTRSLVIVHAFDINTNEEYIFEGSIDNIGVIDKDNKTTVDISFSERFYAERYTNVIPYLFPDSVQVIDRNKLQFFKSWINIDKLRLQDVKVCKYATQKLWTNEKGKIKSEITLKQNKDAANVAAKDADRYMDFHKQKAMSYEDWVKLKAQDFVEDYSLVNLFVKHLTGKVQKDELFARKLTKFERLFHILHEFADYPIEGYPNDYYSLQNFLESHPEFKRNNIAERRIIRPIEQERKS